MYIGFFAKGDVKIPFKIHAFFMRWFFSKNRINF